MAKGIQLLDLNSPIAIDSIGGGMYDNLMGQDYLNNSSNLLDQYMAGIQAPVTDSPKVKNEVNPNVLLNEQLQYVKEQEEYEKKAKERKLKYKKKPVGEIRGEIYREDKDENNKNIGLTALAAAAGLGLIGLANRKAIGTGINNINRYMSDPSAKVFSPKYEDGNPTGRYYPHREKSSVTRGQGALKEWKKAKGINTSLTSTPLTRIAELGTHTVYDAATHGTQSLLWMIHPLEIMAKGAGKVVDPTGSLGGLGQALLAAGALQGSAAVSGAYDATNPSQLFRPEGFKQNNPDSDDGRVSTAPAEELFSRFMLGRTGRPLKYAHAKEEIPDLTIGRYKDYMNYMYRDKGLLNLGLAKATDENLQGVPEARMLGYPVTIDSMGTFLGGVAGAGIGTSLAQKGMIPQRAIQTPAEEEVELNTQKLMADMIRSKDATKEDVAEGKAQAGKDQNKDIRKGNMKAMAGGLAGVALGSVAGHFLGKFIESNVKRANDAFRQQQEIDEGRSRPRGYYVTDGNNQIVSM